MVKSKVMLLLLWSCLMGSALAQEPWESDYRIPQDMIPHHYDLYLYPDLTTDTFTGHVTIHVEATQPRDWFVAHIKYMTVTSTAVKTETGFDIPLLDAFEYEDNEFWVARLVSEVQAGNYTLDMEFNGRMDNGILGFYKSVYLDELGTEHKIATSKFQPTYARRAFPCFDEPSFKSTFTTTLVKPLFNYVALSNMLEESSLINTPEDGLVEVTFQKSVPMVSYLAIFLVCDFVYLESSTPTYGIPFRVYGTAQQQERLDYSLEVGRHITDYYQDYFDIPYPLPKLYMAAIPDYSSGATEHWGLITYRETNLIYDPLESSSSNQQAVASVIAHELAHQWFGNLMTVEWWNDIWLNEGFATYLSYKGVKSYETTWDTESQFLTDDLHRVLELDATLSSHSIVVDVDNADEINAVFDTIAYSKGSSVIRMMENFMGSTDFELGIHNFLVKYSFDTAITQDLFDELAAVSSDSLDITKIMNTWTRQKGYPVLTLTRNGNNYVVTQERFLTDPDAYLIEDEPSDYNYQWEVPVTYISSDDASNRKLVWLAPEDASVTIPIPSGSTWMKFNVGQYGYYRVNYPTSDWEALSQLLVTDLTALSVPDRTSLINDAFSLAAADRLSYEIALDMTKYLGAESEVAPWSVASGSLGYFENVFYYTTVYANVVAYEQDLIDALYYQLGWEDTGDFTTKQLRVIILSMACDAGHTDCLSTAGQLFLGWKNNGNIIAPNLRTIVYNFGMDTVGTRDAWQWMFDRYMAEDNAQEKKKLLNGLTCIKDPAVLYEFIQMAKDISIVREQDYFSMLSYTANNRVGEPIVWDFYRDEWDYLVERFTLNDRSLGSLISSITDRFATQRRLDEMNAFFTQYPDAGAGAQYRDIAVETVETNIKFLENYSGVIDAWLVDNIGN